MFKCKFRAVDQWIDLPDPFTADGLHEQLALQADKVLIEQQLRNIHSASWLQVISSLGIYLTRGVFTMVKV